MARTKQAWTPSADIYWWGELPAEFRQQAGDTLGTHISDAAWEGLCRCAHIYAMGLNHEYVAAPLTEQIKAVKLVSVAARQLVSAIEAADTEANGRAVSYHVGDAWGSIYDHEAEHSRNEQIMVQDLCQVMSETDAWSLLNGWYASGRLQRPEPVADFAILLAEFATSAGIARRHLESDDGPSTTKGDAFQEFIGVLYEWKEANRIPGGVSKGSGNSAGKFTHFIKAILEMVPEIKDGNGKRAEKQMRRPPVADSTLAEAILDAKKAYEASRPINQQGVLDGVLRE